MHSINHSQIHNIFANKYFKALTLVLLSVPIGIINVLLGAGAGLIAVFLLKKAGFEQKQAQTNALAVILPISFMSFIIYFESGYVNFKENIFLVPFSVIGAFIGTFVLGKLSDRAAKISFGLFMIWSGIKLLRK